MQGLELPLLLGALFAFIALRAAVRCAREWSCLFDAELTLRDRQLLGGLAFYWLVPLTVALGLAAALTLLRGWHLPAGDIHYGVYWVRVLPPEDAQLGPLRRALLAALPGLTTVGIALLLIAWTVRSPVRAAHNYLRLELARMLLGLALLLQPTLSLWIEGGSFRVVIHSLNEWLPGAGYALVAIYLAAVGTGIWLWRSPRMRTRYLLLASPLFDEAEQARAELSEDGRNTEARTDLAHSLLIAGDSVPALGLLESVLELDPGHPRAGYLAGVAALKTGDAQRASAHLRAAGERLDREEDDDGRALRFEVILALGAARLALGDNEGALLTMEEATRTEPREPRALFLHAEALVAAGRTQAARYRLERALSHAEGGLARAIRKRLARFP